MPAPSDNTTLAFTPFGKSAGDVSIFFEGACRLRKSKPLNEISGMKGRKLFIKKASPFLGNRVSDYLKPCPQQQIPSIEIDLVNE